PETPLQTLPCTRWLTMASLQCLLRDVSRNFGPKHVWLTEYAYKTDPPDRYRGVSPALQARYLSEAARRAYQAPRVDRFLHRARGGQAVLLFVHAPARRGQPARRRDDSLGTGAPALRSAALPAAALVSGQVATGRQHGGDRPCRLF